MPKVGRTSLELKFLSPSPMHARLDSYRRASESCGDTVRLRPGLEVAEEHIMTKVRALECDGDLCVYRVLILVIDCIGGHNERARTVGGILNDRVLARYQVEQAGKAVL